MNELCDRLLVVEAEPGDADLVRDMLTDPTFQRSCVAHVLRIERASARLAKEAFDVVIVASAVTCLDWRHTLRRLRRITHASMIVVFRGPVDEQAAREAVHEGAQDVLFAEELTPRVVRRAIAQAGELSRARAAVREARELRDREAAKRRDVEGRFSKITAAAQDAIIMIDDQGTIEMWNPAAERIFGYQPQEAIGCNVHELLAPESYLERHRGPFQHFQRTGEGAALGKTLSLEAIRKGGEKFPIELSLSALKLNGRQHAVSIVRDVSDRVRGDEDLRQAHAEMEQIFNAAPPMAVLDLNKTVLKVNSKCAEFLGVEADAVVGKRCRDVLRGTACDTPACCLLSIRQGLASEGKQLKFPRDGRPIPCLVKSYPYRDRHGAIVGCVQSITDISEIRRSEEALRQSEQRYRTLYESTQDAIVIFANEGQLLDGNPGALALFRCRDLEQLRSHTWASLSPSGPPGSIPAGISEVLSHVWKVGSVTCEWRHRRLDGTDFDAILNLTRIELDGATMFQATIRDITLEKIHQQRQAALQRRLAGVNELQERLLMPASLDEKLAWITQAAVELFDLDFCRIWCIREGDLCQSGCEHAAAGDGSHACPRQGNCLHLLASAGRYTHLSGVRRRVPLGYSKIGWIANGCDKRSLSNDLSNDSGVHDHTWTRELGLRAFAGYKLSDGNGSPIGVLAAFSRQVLSDEVDALLANLAETTSKVILESKAAEDLQLAEKRARAANVAKSEFLANMSHEIRTPMTAILGFVDLLANPDLGSDDREEFTAVVRRNGEHLLQLINDILDFSKIEAGKLQCDPAPCDPVAILSDVVNLLRPNAQLKGLDLVVNLGEGVPRTIVSDPVRLRQVLVNLIGNALKFTPKGRVVCHLDLLREGPVASPLIRFDVIDSGIGIAHELLPVILQPFVQADSSISRRYGGSGLGLAITNRLTELLGGRLQVESAPGVGSTFTLILPVGNLSECPEANRVAAASPLSSHGHVESGGRLSRMSILLAEDGLDNQRLIEFLLRQADASVTTVGNGREAVKTALAREFDVVLMDMQMPEMDGYEAARALRRQGYQAPIVALTAHALAEDVERCLAAGCDHYLSKPVDQPRLMETLASCRGDERRSERGSQATAVAASLESRQEVSP